MKFILERTQPDFASITGALKELVAARDSADALDTLPRVAGTIAVEVDKLIEASVITELPIPHMISGDRYNFELAGTLNANFVPYPGAPPIPLPRNSHTQQICVGPLPLLRYQPNDGNGQFFVSAEGFESSCPVTEWLGQRIATIEETGQRTVTVTARDLISIVRNTFGAHAKPKRKWARLHDQFRAVEASRDGTSYPFLFVVAVGIAVCGGDGEIGVDWRLPEVHGQPLPFGITLDKKRVTIEQGPPTVTEDRFIIKAHQSVPWKDGASTADNGPQFHFGPTPPA